MSSRVPGSYSCTVLAPRYPPRLPGSEQNVLIAFCTTASDTQVLVAMPLHFGLGPEIGGGLKLRAGNLATGQPFHFPSDSLIWSVHFYKQWICDGVLLLYICQCRHLRHTLSDRGSPRNRFWGSDTTCKDTSRTSGAWCSGHLSLYKKYYHNSTGRWMERGIVIEDIALDPSGNNWPE